MCRDLQLQDASSTPSYHKYKNAPGNVASFPGSQGTKLLASFPGLRAFVACVRNNSLLYKFRSASHKRAKAWERGYKAIGCEASKCSSRGLSACCSSLLVQTRSPGLGTDGFSLSLSIKHVLCLSYRMESSWVLIRELQRYLLAC